MTLYDPDVPSLELPWRTSSTPPTFRFIAQLDGDELTQLRVYPYGFTKFELDRVAADDRVVVGEIKATDDRHAEVFFAHGSDEDRDLTSHHLKIWCRKDRWSLKFQAGTHPLTAVDPPVHTHWTPARCDGCSEFLGTGWATHMKWSGTGWQHTWCHGCGGRLRWYTLPGDSPLPND